MHFPRRCSHQPLHTGEPAAWSVGFGTDCFVLNPSAQDVMGHGTLRPQGGLCESEVLATRTTVIQRLQGGRGGRVPLIDGTVCLSVKSRSDRHPPSPSADARAQCAPTVVLGFSRRSRVASRRPAECPQKPPIGCPSGPSVRSSMVAALRMMAASCSWLPCCLDTNRRWLVRLIVVMVSCGELLL